MKTSRLYSTLTGKVLFALLIAFSVSVNADAQGVSVELESAVADSVAVDSVGSMMADSVKAVVGDSTKMFVADSIKRNTLIVPGNPDEGVKPTKWTADMEENPKLPFFQGFTMSVDALSAGMRLFNDYGTFEAALRLSLKNTYLPIVEIGVANCDHTDYSTHIKYNTSAPFFRLGIDYNLLKNKHQNNRMFAGLRYGFSTYFYDISGPDQVDNVWGGSAPFSLSNISCTSHWLEVVLGCQVKIVGVFHLGWSVRLKYHLKSSSNIYSKPYYIPGYGTTQQGNTWGGSFNFIFDLNWGKKKTSKTISVTKN